MRGRKAEPASVRDAKGNPGKRSRSKAKGAKTLPLVPPLVTPAGDTKPTADTKMLRLNPLFMVQARNPLVSVRGDTQSPLVSASFGGVSLSPRPFPLDLPVSLSHRKSETRFRFAGVVADVVRADAPSLSR